MQFFKIVLDGVSFERKMVLGVFKGILKINLSGKQTYETYFTENKFSLFFFEYGLE